MVKDESEIMGVVMFGGIDFPDKIKRIMQDAGLLTTEKYFVVLDGSLTNRRAIARMAGVRVPTK